MTTSLKMLASACSLRQLFQDLSHSFSLYGPTLSKPITYVHSILLYTVTVKCKLTVSTRNLILDPRCFRESRIEFQGSSFELRVSSIEFWDARRIFRESDLYLEFVTIEINNTACCVASFVCARVHVFHIKVQIVSLELKSWIAII